MNKHVHTPTSACTPLLNPQNKDCIDQSMTVTKLSLDSKKARGERMKDRWRLDEKGNTSMLGLIDS